MNADLEAAFQALADAAAKTSEAVRDLARATIELERRRPRHPSDRMLRRQPWLGQPGRR